MIDTTNFEVIIIGGSSAGLSAAMALGRSLRSVLIIDSGMPCNRQTPHSHNFLTQDGETPAAILAKAKEQVLKYDTVKFLNDTVIAGRKTDHGFVLSTENNLEVTARKLIFATGIKDTIPEIKGFDQCWGISAIHCPYCHGFEFRNLQTGIVANGDRAFHLASLVNNLTDKITIFTSGKTAFTAEQLEKLNKHNIQIIETEISELEHTKGHLKNIILSTGAKIAFQGVYAALPFTQHSDIPSSLGCKMTEHGFISVDQFQKTSVEHVFACGDNSSMMRSIATAVYGGNLAGAMVNKELTDESF